VTGNGTKTKLLSLDARPSGVIAAYSQVQCVWLITTNWLTSCFVFQAAKWWVLSQVIYGYFIFTLQGILKVPLTRNIWRKKKVLMTVSTIIITVAIKLRSIKYWSSFCSSFIQDIDQNDRWSN